MPPKKAPNTADLRAAGKTIDDLLLSEEVPPPAVPVERKSATLLKQEENAREQNTPYAPTADTPSATPYPLPAPMVGDGVWFLLDPAQPWAAIVTRAYFDNPEKVDLAIFRPDGTSLTCMRGVLKRNHAKLLECWDYRGSTPPVKGQ